ncbi:Glycoside hydrolase [Mycena kentingensis (nom. inval.)]|nr:Glycoside hydrolase [Mycena kentingensis (nom. inval.)]
MRSSELFLVLCVCISAIYAAATEEVWALRSELRQLWGRESSRRALDRRAIPAGWSSVGCVTDGSSRALSYSYTSSSMTQDACTTTCDGKGYIYAGTQYSNECWCGNSLNNGYGVATAASECNSRCAGNSAQVCGGSYRLTFFKKVTTWSQSQACAVDTASHLLKAYSTTLSNNTPANCQAVCQGKGYSIAAVEYGNECYCGNSFTSQPANAAASDCNMKCAGDASQTCGAGYRMQVYVRSTSTATTTTATTTSTTTMTTTATTTTTGTTTTGSASTPTWAVSQACAVDTSSHLLKAYSTTLSTNTPANCQTVCKGRGYSIAAVEYGNECYCGNSFTSQPTNAAVADCLYPLELRNDNDDRNDDYSATGGWTLATACAVDASPHFLNAYSTTLSTNTPANCQAVCQGRGYSIASVEYGNECYCGNSFTSTPATAPASDCNMKCAGDASQMCGAGWRMQIYTRSTTTAPSSTWARHILLQHSLVLPIDMPKPWVLEFSIAAIEYGNECYCGNDYAFAPVAAPVADCSINCSGDSTLKCGGSWRGQVYTLVASTTATLTPTPTFVEAPVASGWTISAACVADSTPSSILQGYNSMSASLTPAACQDTCRSNGMGIAGVKQGSTCLCGNAFVGGTPANVNATTNCATPCSGNSSYACGGATSLTVYTAVFSGAAPLADGWSLTSACSADNATRPVLQGYSETSTTLTPAVCQDTCRSKGFGIAGVEERSCLCGNGFVGGTPAVANTTDCNAPCGGDSALACGGKGKVSLYTRTFSEAPVSSGWALMSVCVVDNATAPILQGYSETSVTVTPASCQETCSLKGFPIAGVSGSSCFCGNGYVGGTPVNADPTECIAPCSGDSAYACGGLSRLSTYSVVYPAPPLAPGWSLSRACAANNASAAVLQGYTYQSPSMTPASCQTTCGARGFAIAGVLGGDTCMCGNAFVGANGAPPFASAGECVVACSGDSAYACGGVNRITVFTSTTASIVDVWQTLWDKSTLMAPLNLDPIAFSTPIPPGETDVTVDDTAVYQQMDGFGAALTDASARLFSNLKMQNRDAYDTMLHQLFDTSNGVWSAASNVLRIPLGSSDFSQYLWTYDDVAGDVTFSRFNIDNAPSYVWPILADIVAINPGIKIHLSPWSPPAWMKDSGTMNGGSLKSNYVQYYATYLYKAVQGFTNKGYSIYAIAIQNEPQYSDSSYPSCTLSVATEATIGNSLRMLLNLGGLSSVRILGFDHNFGQTAEYAIPLMQQAPTAFAGSAFHCYSGSSTNLEAFRAAVPAKEIHITECSGVNGTNWWNDIKGYTDNLFIGGPQHGSKSAMMWNLALNSTGQPKLPGSRSCGGYLMPCRGVVQINADGTAARRRGGQFAKRIGVNVIGSFNWSLRVSAYMTPRVSPLDLTCYNLVVLNWRDYASIGFNITAQLTTINFRGVQAQYTFPVGLTTLSWYA